jgi:hypothetical protein
MPVAIALEPLVVKVYEVVETALAITPRGKRFACAAVYTAPVVKFVLGFIAIVLVS